MLGMIGVKTMWQNCLGGAMGGAPLRALHTRMGHMDSDE
jgi:hypothetical protein